MRRISVVGVSGSGKSTVAARLAERLAAPLLELDSVYHQADWVPLPAEEMTRRVEQFTAAPAWVIDGNYSLVREPVVWPRADTVIWVDPPRRTVMRQVSARSVRRAVSQQPLWNGNRERLGNLFSWDPERSMIRWTWTRYAPTREKFLAAMADPSWSRLRFVRLRTRSEIDRFVEAGLS